MSRSPHPQFYGWHMLMALWFIYFAVVGFGLYGSPVMFPHMIDDLGWNRGQISTGYTVFMLTLGAMSPVSAWSIKRIGGRLTMFIGGTVGACGMLLMVFIDALPLYFFAFGVLSGIGNVLGSNIPVQTVMTHWFRRRRGTAFGLVLAGGSFGGFVAPLALAWAIDSSGGHWRLGWVIIAAMMLLSAFTSLIFVRNRPADLGQHPDGRAPAIGMRTEEPSREESGSRIYRCETDWTLAEALRTRQLWMVLAMVIGAQYIWQIFVTQGPLHLADRGFTTQQYSLIYGLTIGLSIIGRIGAGFIIDRIEPRQVFVVVAALGMAGSIMFWFISPERPVTFLFPVCTGIAFGAVTILWPNIVANYWGPNAFAAVNGVIFPTMVVVNSTAAPLAGIMFDRIGSYLPAFAVAWGMMAVAFTAALRLTPPSRR